MNSKLKKRNQEKIVIYCGKKLKKCLVRTIFVLLQTNIDKK